jgi:hypothetical protein
MGKDKTKDLIRRKFWSPKMNKDIVQDVQSCPKCQKNTAGWHESYSPLQPLKLGYLRWKSIAIDFITDLLLNKGCDQLLIIINGFTKMEYIRPCKTEINRLKIAWKDLPERYRNCTAYQPISIPAETPDSHEISGSPS